MEFIWTFTIYLKHFVMKWLKIRRTLGWINKNGNTFLKHLPTKNIILLLVLFQDKNLGYKLQRGLSRYAFIL